MPMYNLLEYSFNYSYTGCLFFYFKDEVINFNADIADNSKSFSFKAKFLGNRAADGENGILRHTTIAVSLMIP